MKQFKDKKITAKWAVLSVLFLFFYLTFCFPDILTTYDGGIRFFSGIFTGRFSEIYNYESIFYIPFHFLFGIWCLPITLLELAGVHLAESVFACLWAKLLPVLFLAGCICIFRRLLKETGCRDLSFWTFFLCVSPLIWGPVFAMAQYDVIELFFGMWAVLLAAKEKELSWKSLFLLSVAVACKFIFIFGAVLIVLIKEKRIVYLIRDAFAILGVSLLLLLVFGFGGLTTEPGDLENTYFFSKIISVSISGLIDIPVLFLIFAADCAVAYFYMRPENSREFVVDTAWALSCCYIAFILLIRNSHPQWAVILPPFLFLMMAARDASRVENILVGSAFQLGTFVMQIYVFDWVYLVETSFDRLILRNVHSLYLNGSDVWNAASLIRRFGLDKLMPVVSSFTMALAILLLVRNNVWRPAANIECGQITTDRVSKGAEYFMLAVVFLYLLASVFIAFVV